MKWFLIALALILLAVACWLLFRPSRTTRTPTSRPKGRPSGPRPAPPPGRTAKSGGRAAGSTATAPRPARPAGPVPEPGEIWWADVPYEDGPGHKVRPCVVLRANSDGHDVLKITSQDQSHRNDHVEIPTRPWDPDADHNSFLDLTDPIAVPAADFSDKAGVLDAATWKKVRALHNVA